MEREKLIESLEMAKETRREAYRLLEKARAAYKKAVLAENEAWEAHFKTEMQAEAKKKEG